MQWWSAHCSHVSYRCLLVGLCGQPDLQIQYRWGKAQGCCSPAIAATFLAVDHEHGPSRAVFQEDIEPLIQVSLQAGMRKSITVGPIFKRQFGVAQAVIAFCSSGEGMNFQVLTVLWLSMASVSSTLKRPSEALACVERPA